MSEKDLTDVATLPFPKTHDVIPVALQQKSFFGARMRMAMFTLGGVLAFLAHHYFYRFCHGRPVNDNTIAILQSHLRRDSVDSQAFTSTIGNTIATVAKICFAGATATAFSQLFWWQLRRRAGTIEQINGVLSFRASPFVPTSWMAWASFPALSAIAFAAVPLIAITIATPGSLTVEGADIKMPCRVPTVNLSQSHLYSFGDPDVSTATGAAPTADTYQLIAAVMMSGSFLNPSRPEADGEVVGFDIEFYAPALKCTDITDSFDFDHHLPYIARATDSDPVTATVWNATYNYQAEDPSFDFVVARRGLGQAFLSDVAHKTLDGQHADLEAVSCTPYNATYLITGIDDIFEDASLLNITSLTLGAAYEDISDSFGQNFEAQQHFTLYDALARTLSSTVNVNFYLNTTAVSGNKFVAYSALSFTANTDPWAWHGKLVDTLPQLMQNVSLSLLSGNPVSVGGVQTTQKVEMECLVSGLWFQYNKVRLLATYFAAGGCAIVVVAFGFLAVHVNDGMGETLDFSRILGSGLVLREKAASMGGTEADISMHTVVRAENKPFGALCLE